MLDSGSEGPGFQSGNSIRQTVHTHRASVHQTAKLVAALLMVAMATAGLAESNDSLSPGLWLTSPAGDCKELGSAPESYAWQSSTSYLSLYLFKCKCTRASCQVDVVTLKMHDLKMTDKENYGSGKCRTGKWRTNLRALAFLCSVCWRCGLYAKSAVSYTYWHGYACVFFMCIWRTIVRHFSN